MKVGEFMFVGVVGTVMVVVSTAVWWNTYNKVQLEKIPVENFIQEKQLTEPYTIQKITIVSKGMGSSAVELNGGFLHGSSAFVTGESSDISLLAVCQHVGNESETFILQVPIAMTAWTVSQQSDQIAMRLEFPQWYLMAPNGSYSKDVRAFSDWRVNPNLALERVSQVRFTVPSAAYEQILAQLDKISVHQ